MSESEETEVADAIPELEISEELVPNLDCVMKRLGNLILSNLSYLPSDTGGNGLVYVLKTKDGHSIKRSMAGRYIILEGDELSRKFAVYFWTDGTSVTFSSFGFGKLEFRNAKDLLSKLFNTCKDPAAAAKEARSIVSHMLTMESLLTNHLKESIGEANQILRQITLALRIAVEEVLTEETIKRINEILDEQPPQPQDTDRQES